MPKPPGGKPRSKGSTPAGLSPAARGNRCNFEGAFIFPTAEQDKGEVSPERGRVGGRHAAGCFHPAQGGVQFAVPHQIPELTVQR